MRGRKGFIAHAIAILLLSSATLLGETNSPGVTIDLTRLPPPSTNRIDFSRDIKPIFDASCIRCHGAEKPKSGFRLDNRNFALKGGDDGKDIVPGNSEKSPLIHYTARLVNDLEMPPTGKGEPLTAAQVGLLRAWIDQGAAWENVIFTNSASVSLLPLAGGTIVSGDSQKFRELNWRREGASGGLSDFELTRRDNPDTTLTLSGHVLPQDYQVHLSLDRNEIGFIHSGLDQYRKYYDDTGGFHPSPSTPVAPSLGRDLYLDIGKAWVDFGLTLPNLPRMVIGYEYDYQRGAEATTSWGAAGTGANIRSIAPNSESISEGTQIIKFDLDANVKGVAIAERFRGEFYTLGTQYTNLASRNAVTQNVKEHDGYFQGANTIQAETKFKDWLFVSGGYLYSRLNADSSFTNVTRVINLTFAGSVPEITLDRESHVVNGNVLIGPLDGLTLSTGAQGEWTTQHGFGAGKLNQIPFTRTSPVTLVIEPTTLSANYDDRLATEEIAARYTTIPYTVLFAEARLRQESMGQLTSDLQPTGNFIENINYSSQLADVRAGFTTSPWRTVSFTAHYRRYENDSAYPPAGPAHPTGGYPDYFRSRELITDEVEAKLVVRPCNWLKTTLSYQLESTDFRANVNPASNSVAPVVYSPGGELLTGRYDTQIYSIGAVLMPNPRVYLVGSFSYQPSKTRSADSTMPASPPYRGDVYTAETSGTYVLSKTTDFTVGWTFSEADFGQNDGVATVPLGIVYQEHSINASLTRQFNQYLSGRLQYGYDYYREPSSGGATDFHAHSIFASLNLRLP